MREENGQFAEGNQLWKLRDPTKTGKPVRYDNPKLLWKDIKQYFQWVEDNPYYETKVTVLKGEASHEKVPKLRPYTLTGLCTFLGIIVSTWTNWKKNRPDLQDIIFYAEQIIYENKISGATADVFNANIISRELGLADKQDHTSSDGSVGTKVAVVLPAAPGSLDMDQWQDMYKQVMARRKSVHDLPQRTEIIEESPEQSDAEPDTEEKSE